MTSQYLKKLSVRTTRVFKIALQLEVAKSNTGDDIFLGKEKKTFFP
jgi:hypothetical protein